MDVARSHYYEMLATAEERAKKSAEEKAVRKELAEIVLDEWLRHDAYGYQKMSRHLKRKRSCGRDLESS